jgi:hypothetical protein
MSNELPFQIDYTSRDYDSLIADLKSLVNLRTENAWTAEDPNDLGTVVLESFAYMGDILSYYIDRVANELSVETAARRQTLVNLGLLFGYRVSGPTPATIEVTFENISTQNIAIPVGTQVLATLQYGNYSEVYFETVDSATSLAPGGTITLTCLEGKTVNTDKPNLISETTNKPLPVNLGNSTGRANQTLSLFDTGVVDNSVTVYVGQNASFTPWKFVDTLLEWGPTSLVFTTSIDEYGVTSIVFGDGVNGRIPPVGQAISALYKTSLGIAGNIAANTVEEVTFLPGNTVKAAVSYLSVTNAAASYGGADGDDLTQIRSKVKAAIATRKRAVTLTDYENLAALVAQVGRAKASSSVYTSVTLYLQSQNDGSVTPGLLLGTETSLWTSMSENVKTYLADKIPVGTTLTVLPPTYVELTVKLTITVKSSYKADDVSKAIRAAFINSNGLFSYENQAFGQDVSYASIIATAYNVDAVKNGGSVTVNKFNRLGDSSSSTSGIVLTDAEIAVLPTENLEIIVNATA